MKEQLLPVLLYTHIIAGGTALLSGLAAIVTTKGNKVHRRAGVVYFYAMLLVALSAFVISIAKSNMFLLAISIFSFYLTWFGYRAIKNRQAKFVWYDWAVVVFSAATALYMIYSRNIILVAFGLILVMLASRNAQAQLSGEEKLKEARRLRLLAHSGNMLGSYIATVTAFAVVNINFVKPGWIIWLLPTALGLPAILYYNHKLKATLKQ